MFSESRFRDICSYVAMVDARSTHEIILTAICCGENAGRGAREGRGKGGGWVTMKKAVTMLVLLMRSLNDFSIVIYISRKNGSVCFLYRDIYDERILR